MAVLGELVMWHQRQLRSAQTHPSARLLDKIVDRIVEAGQDAPYLGILQGEQQLPSSSAPSQEEEKEKVGRNEEQRVRGEEKEKKHGEEVAEKHEQSGT